MSDSTSSSIPVGSTGAGGGNMLRITGLNTGLDIDAMVEKMLISDKTKVNKAKQQQQLIEWKQEAYQDIISDIKDLQSSFFDITDSSNYILSSSNYNNMVGESSDSTVVAASALTTAVSGNYKILVKQLAESASITGTNKVQTSDGKNADSSTKLTDIGLSEGTYSFKLTYGSNDTTTITFDITDSSTISDVITAIKTQTDGQVTGRLNDLTGQFSIQTSDTGTSSNLKIENVSNGDTLLNALGITTLGEEIQGQNALFAIKEPGSSDYIVGENSSNSFTINGVRYTISDSNSTNSDISESNVGKSISEVSGDSPVSVSVSKDTSKIHDLISNFIDKYNDLIVKIRDKLQEKKDYDYPPLTDEQKEEMTDSQISKWEEKAKQGILRNDDNLENLLNDLENAFTTPVVDSDGNRVSTLYFGSIGENSIGIDTSSKISDAGKISITDDTKFTDAITNNADEIIKLFTTTSDSSDSEDKFNQSGIFQRIKDILVDNVGVVGSTLNNAILTKYANLQEDYSVTGTGGSGTLPDQIYTQQLLIDKLTDQMNDDQTKYYNQFTALETAMEQLNAQQSILSAYLS